VAAPSGGLRSKLVLTPPISQALGAFHASSDRRSRSIKKHRPRVSRPSHRLCRINAIAFVALVLMRFRAHEVRNNVACETDWGQKFGDDNLSRVTRLSPRYLQPPGGDLCRYPLGRKGYNGPAPLVTPPPVLIDHISTDLTLACRTKGGDDLLATYTLMLRDYSSFFPIRFYTE